MITCPRCEGQEYDVDACSLCGNLGVLDEDGIRLHKQQLWNEENFRLLLVDAHREGLSGRRAWRWAAKKAGTL